VPEPVLDLEEVQHLLRARVASVLGLDEPPALDARFDEDLHADSLDLVEIIEGVESELSGRGVAAALPDEVLLDLRTVAEAAERIHAAARPA
jgi:acyl carrier protein